MLIRPRPAKGETVPTKLHDIAPIRRRQSQSREVSWTGAELRRLIAISELCGDSPMMDRSRVTVSRESFKQRREQSGLVQRGLGTSLPMDYRFHDRCLGQARKRLVQVEREDVCGHGSRRKELKLGT
jgi:hypothetical protein